MGVWMWFVSKSEKRRGNKREPERKYKKEVLQKKSGIAKCDKCNMKYRFIYLIKLKI